MTNNKNADVIFARRQATPSFVPRPIVHFHSPLVSGETGGRHYLSARTLTSQTLIRTLIRICRRV
jgi:hypothetical protein